MQYRVDAYKCKINSVIELSDDMIPVGTVYIGEDLFVIVLDPLEERRLPEEDLKAEEEGKAEKTEEEHPDEVPPGGD